jgi:spermidine synthase
VAAAVPALLALLAGVAAARSDPDRPEGLVHAEQSAYADLRVIDRNGIRYLLLDGGVHTAQEVASGLALHPYAAVVDLAKLYFDEPGSLLLVGLGGGSVARSWAADGWDVDAVEIDAAVARIARTYFGLEPRHARIHVMDGRRFLREADREWDVIVFDAFGSSAIPFHLVTREAFALAAARVAPGGLLVVNVETRAWDDPIVAALGTTIAETFDHVLALPIAEPPNTLGNLILLATDRADPALPSRRLLHPADALGQGWIHWATVQRNHAWDNRFRPPVEGAPVLTDDLNPVDTWAEEINLVARRALHVEFGEAVAW